jgi:hypothetical protein
MQGRQPAVEPGVIHKGWKPINALQQLLIAGDKGGVFGLSP